jgi:hypothetical protein
MFMDYRRGRKISEKRSGLFLNSFALDEKLFGLLRGDSKCQVPESGRL